MIGSIRLQALVLNVDSSPSEDGTWQCGVLEDGEGRRTRFVATGLRRLPQGSDVDVSGAYETNPRFGDQFRILQCRRVTLPVTTRGLELLLQGAVAGIGPKLAHVVVSALGLETITRLNGNPAILRELIPGRRGVSAEYAWTLWAREHGANERAMEFAGRLVSAGEEVATVRKLMSFFRTPEVAAIVLRKHPYRLREVPGFGWKRTERFARRLGVARDHEERLEAAVITAMEAASASGHSCAPEADVVRWATSHAGSASLARRGLEIAEASCALVRDGDRLYLPVALEAERKVASGLRRHMAAPSQVSASRHRVLDRLVTDADLSDLQARAVRGMIDNGVFALTGGPGTGKTWTLRTAIRCGQALGWRSQLVAPTGKAAARAAEVSGVQASTVHRLIGGAPGSRRRELLDPDLLIVDEASMVSVEVFAWMLESLSPRTRILLVGDPAQLPSVDHGAVLRDVLSAGIPSVRLETPRRQAQHSGIVMNAGRVLRGESLLPNRSDFLRADVTDRTTGGSPPDPGREEVRALERLAGAVRWLRSEGAELTAGVQVLTPTNRGRLGAEALNADLQSLVNPEGASGPRIGGALHARLGDRVQQVRNDYTLGPTGVFNGEQGVVTRVSPGSATVRFGEEREISISGYRLFNLRLAWAVTVHRSQGSEWQNVITRFHRSQRRVLSRELLYTAITRARERFILIGDEEAYREICDPARRHTQVRHTGLAQRLVTR